MKKFISALLCVSSFSFASMIGVDALGEEQIAGGSAAMAGRGFAGSAKTVELLARRLDRRSFEFPFYKHQRLAPVDELDVPDE